MKGRPLAKQGYEQELSSIRAFVSMQNKSDGSGGASSGSHGVSVHVCLTYSRSWWYGMGSALAIMSQVLYIPVDVHVYTCTCVL